MRKSSWCGSWKKVVILFFLSIIFTFAFNWDVVYDWFDRTTETESRETSLYCFELGGNKFPELKETEPDLGSGIFFHETSCQNQILDISLNARQSCSIESALRAHPDKDVFLLISSPIYRSLEETENILIRQLLRSYANFKPRHITVSKYLSNTPLRSLYASGILNFSSWPVQHSSDVLRYATLFKFGGIYLDLDVIVLKSLAKFKNFAGAESNFSLGSGILGFGFDKAGREVARQCVVELASSYDPRKWGINGPGTITRVMQNRCETSSILGMLKKPCKGFKVYPAEYFQAISFRDVQVLFNESLTAKILDIVNGSYTLHFWNKMSSSYVLDNRLATPFIIYARKHCPKVYEATEGNFN